MFWGEEVKQLKAEVKELGEFVNLVRWRMEYGLVPNSSPMSTYGYFSVWQFCSREEPIIATKNNFEDFCKKIIQREDIKLRAEKILGESLESIVERHDREQKLIKLAQEVEEGKKLLKGQKKGSGNKKEQK